MINRIACIDCHSRLCHKTGLLKGNQRRQCNDCGRHFTEGSKSSYSIHEKRWIVKHILIDKMSYRQSAKIFDIPTCTIQKRVKLFKKGVI